ncbi:hypothetical protein RXV95_03070 [Novosphingobium sp. ZN18A2]|uniref:hypothetical protein n=1 Tax=Novosphingobium sp. ZN18A2 TaxID=3079861 RepID=UPI0030D51FDA
MSSKQRKSQPVTAHRLFPAIVALWFAALFGIGSFVVPPALLSRAVSATGLPALVPAAAPPLGFTARALVALAMAGIGVAVGLVVAMRIKPREDNDSPARSRFAFGRKREEEPEALPPRRRARDAHPDAPARRPVAASEDLSDVEPFDKVDADGADEVHEFAAEDLQVRRISPDMECHADEAASARAAAIVQEPIEIAAGQVGEDIGAPSVERPADEVAAEYDDAELADFEPVEPEIAPRIERQAGDAPPATVSEAPRKPASPAPSASPVATRPVEELGTVQLVERLAVAMAARRKAITPAQEPPQEPPMSDFGASEPADASQNGYAGREFAEAEAPHFVANDAAADVRPEPPAADASAPAQAPEGQSNIASDDIAPAAQGDAVAEERAASRVVPFRTLAFDSAADDDFDDDEEQPAQLQRFLGAGAGSNASGISSAPVGAESGDDGENTTDERYSSLLELRESLPANAFVRIDVPENGDGGIEPVVVFPGEGARPRAPFGASQAHSGDSGVTAASAVSQPDADPAETDRALRAALATLQRMTGNG